MYPDKPGTARPLCRYGAFVTDLLGVHELSITEYWLQVDITMENINVCT